MHIPRFKCNLTIYRSKWLLRSTFCSVFVYMTWLHNFLLSENVALLNTFLLTYYKPIYLFWYFRLFRKYEFFSISGHMTSTWGHVTS